MISAPAEYKAIGMMSGTSLDGIDIAYCTFLFREGRWHHMIHHAQTFPYSKRWRSFLGKLPAGDKAVLAEADAAYGRLIGQTINRFIRKYSPAPDFIGSHGHTVFHDPSEGITLQIGDGKTIADITGITVVSDFRSQDLRFGGQGAPLVPVGDRLLFQEYEYCLNLGGFANVSFDQSGRRTGFDIGPCNLVLNHLSSLMGRDYDEGGLLARKGEVSTSLLEQLNALPYYLEKAPKSLGREWVDAFVFPLLNEASEHPLNLLRTFTEHIAYQVAKAIDGKALVTGGGAYNAFLVERIRELSGKEIIVPDDLTIQFKEALIFAFLAALRLRDEINVLGSVTGASRDHSAGTVHHPA